ncbi:hypothetical protein [Clostridium perfringens]|uniref:Uncharacterized protein n=1 Tax=Clostridium perfringens TaxID=1502 RepID=A0A133N1D3_CLOPF|nr:hypothetical protein [Clostridium perfringens]KXA10122.1 hypothetical protein HMPREF3222_02136 [Clostridium perfringens]
MSSITTIISNSDGKASLTQMDSKGFRFEEVKTSIEKLDVSKCEKIPEFIAIIGNKLNEAIEVINILKAENEVLKNKIETKVSLQDIDNSLSKIKRFEK